MDYNTDYTEHSKWIEKTADDCGIGLAAIRRGRGLQPDGPLHFDQVEHTVRVLGAVRCDGCVASPVCPEILLPLKV